jgi:hypothetical protein
MYAKKQSSSEAFDDDVISLPILLDIPLGEDRVVKIIAAGELPSFSAENPSGDLANKCV